MDDRLVGGGCLMVIGCAAVSAAVPGTHPVLAIAGLAGLCMGAAAALDDEAATVTDASPRPLRRRILGRAPLAGLPLVTWVVVSALLDSRYTDWPFLFVAAVGVAAWIAAFGLAAAGRRAGVATPGEAVGTAMGSLVLVLLLAAPSVRDVSPFSAEPAALFWWVPIAAVGVAALIHGTRDRMASRSLSVRW